jgi:hypothetical protein
MAFHTKYGHYEYIIIYFGLTKAPTTVMETMNRMLHEYLDDFITVFLDDILLYSKSHE